MSVETPRGAKRLLPAVKRRELPPDLVQAGPLAPGRRLPVVVRPAVPGLDLAGWAGASRAAIEEQLDLHGAVLFRDFLLGGVAAFEAFLEAVSDGLLEYRERSSPRRAVGPHTYTSTEYPPEQSIFVHNENAYQRRWPLKICFYCETPADSGGETPLCDMRAVLARIDPQVRAGFERRGVLYVRNFGHGLGLSWQDVFQTDDPAEVERYCRAESIELEWLADGRLRTRQRRHALARHPRTGEAVWFNHATVFHVSTLPEPVRAALVSGLREEDLPNNSYYGDGGRIEPEVLEHLREVYRAESGSFPWQRGDVLLVDNMLVAHGRASYTGARRVLVGMADPVSMEASSPRGALS